MAAIRTAVMAALLAIPAGAQMQGVFSGVLNPEPIAAAPTFSPASGYTGGATTVTASTATGACSAYIYFGTTNPPTVNTSTYSFTATITLYAYVHGCPGYNDSTVSTWSGTYSSGSFTVVQTGVCAPSTGGTVTALPCSFSSGFTSGDTVLYYSQDSSVPVSASSAGTWTGYGATASLNGVVGVIAGMAGGTTSFNLTIPSTYLNAANYGVIYELSGPNSAAPVDQYCGWGYSYTTTSGCGVTTTGSEDIVCTAVVAGSDGTSAMTPTTGYSALNISSLDSLGGLMACTTSPVTPNTYTPSWNLNGQTEIGYMTIAFTL